jgi:hypothetical protein
VDNDRDNWFDNDRDNVHISYLSDSDDFDYYNPYWYWGWYDGRGFDWDGPVTPADCWD